MLKGNMINYCFQVFSCDLSADTETLIQPIIIQPINNNLDKEIKGKK